MCVILERKTGSIQCVTFGCISLRSSRLLCPRSVGFIPLQIQRRDSLALIARVFLQKTFCSGGRNFGFGTDVQIRGVGCAQHHKPVAVSAQGKEFWVLLLTMQSTQEYSEQPGVCEVKNLHARNLTKSDINVFQYIMQNQVFKLCFFNIRCNNIFQGHWITCCCGNVLVR